MPVQKLTFTGATGAQLAARLDLPADQAPVAYALFAHCFTCTKNQKAISAMSQALTLAGVAVLRFDFTGLGESEGDFAETNFSSNVGDLVAAAACLGERFAAPTLLIGHSLGGAAVLQAAAQIPSARAVVTIGAPCSPTHVTALLGADAARIEADGAAQVTLAGRSFTITKQFLDDLALHRMDATIHALRCPLLICHAPRDEVVGIENAAHIFGAARHPKSFISLDNADHFLSERRDAQYVGTLIAAWSSAYIAPPVSPAAPAPDDGRVVARTGAHGYRTTIFASGHHLVADEPLSVGGGNTGPTPYDYLAAGLGACTSMTLRMYADRKGWPLEDVTVRLRHSKIHAEDCASCETDTGTLDQITREITLAGPLSDEQRQRLLEIADKCPVHRTLNAEIDIPTTLALEAIAILSA